MVVADLAVTKESVLRWEKERVAQYQRDHGGQGPMYNTNGLS
jgi:hypothetical protein